MDAFEHVSQEWPGLQVSVITRFERDHIIGKRCVLLAIDLGRTDSQVERLLRFGPDDTVADNTWAHILTVRFEKGNDVVTNCWFVDSPATDEMRRTCLVDWGMGNHA